MQEKPSIIVNRLNALKEAYYDRTDSNEFTREYFTKDLLTELYAQEEGRLWGISFDDVLYSVENSAMAIVRISREEKTTIEEMLDIIEENHPATVKCVRAMYPIEELYEFMEKM